MTAATEPLGVSQVFPRPSMEIFFKDRYIVSGSAMTAAMAAASAVASQNDLKIQLWFFVNLTTKWTKRISGYHISIAYFGLD